MKALTSARQTNVRQRIYLAELLPANPGTILVIFPEGTRSTTGETQEFKCGIGALVAGRDVAVVPCFIDGSFRAWPKGRRLPRPKRVRLIVGTPRNYRSRNTDKIDISAIAAELREAVNKLHQTNESH